MSSSETEKTLESYGSRIGERMESLARARDWVLVDADRLAVAGGVTVGVFVLFYGLGELGVVSFANDDSITRLAGGMIAGTFSLVTLVVSINQLILSREFSAADQSRTRLEGVIDFRSDVADAADVPAAPASPARLLELLLAIIGGRATALADAVADHDDELCEEINRYTDTVEAHTERVTETLEGTAPGTYSAVSAAVGYDDAWQTYAARHLRGRYADSLSPEATNAIDDLIASLELFAVAREHFKTTYLQRELTRFSQLTIYAGVPAILSAMLIGFLYADVGGPSVSLTRLPVVVSALVAVVVSPLALLVSYILRTATVARRTASVGPMLPQKASGEGPFEVGYDDGRAVSDEPAEARGVGRGVGSPDE